MAATAPYSLNFPKHDAREFIELTWINGGDLQHAFEIEIYVNDGSTTPFYTIGRTPSYLTRVDLPVNTLINGVEYKWRVRVYNQANDVSPWSDYSLIIASARPAPTITNVSGTLYAQRYTFIGAYSQAQNVAIKSYRFRLFREGSVIAESPLTFSTDIRGTFALETETAYEIELETVSQNDVTGISSRYPFTTSYQKPTQSQAVVAQNAKELAAVRLQWRNPTIITLPTTKPAQFVPGVYDQALSLADGNAVYYNEQFSGNSTVMFWAIPAVDSSEFNGVIARLRDTYREFIEIGYDHVGKRFFCRFKNRGQTIVRGSSTKTFSANTPIFIAFNHNACYVGINGAFERF